MRTARILAIAGVVIGLLGSIVTVIFFFQPWRSCDDEDTSVGGSMLPVDAAVMTAAMLAVPVGVAIAIAGLAMRARHRQAQVEPTDARRQGATP